MATTHNFFEKFKGESIGITFTPRMPDGSLIPEPETYKVIFTISKSLGGSPSLMFYDPPQVVLSDPTDSIWTITLQKDDLDPIIENRTYYYNIWSQAPSGNMSLQVKGQLKLKSSIEPQPVL